VGFHIGLMGPIVATRSGDVVTPTRPKLRQLLALLALEDGAAVRSDVIAHELWGAAPSSAAAGRSAVSRWARYSAAAASGSRRCA
jgi:DNA-binding SARP family transcriptional activator